MLDPTSSAAGSPAKTSASQAKEPASTANAQDYGHTMPAPFANYDPAACLWKTSQLSLVEGSIEYSGTWPRAGTMQNGIAYQRQPSAPRTYATAFSLSRIAPTLSKSRLLATPKAGDAIMALPRTSGRSAAMSTHLATQIRYRTDLLPPPVSLTSDGLLTTPCADDTGHRKGKYAQGGTALSAQVGGKLNPQWLEWLMGFPNKWTESSVLVTR